jgi:hypothetical protein
MGILFQEVITTIDGIYKTVDHSVWLAIYLNTETI